ncbi:MAG: class I SAM-dependent methyltransferase [Alphaproteobacteria bacterium]|nr:class I SAM-dependent methyltransferase [Alphaproteobacteria bacterium]MBV9373292.1 class I SAM-dependent methyltransferase [Alphaproteobacteria bacterium]MBV9901255.1 class I SAM-dependent methyltransferase [Alphaproteobacteria bacterium]
MGCALAAAGCATTTAPSPTDYAAALADPVRPDADRARDADRKPAELLAFAGVGAGDKVAELAPGGGYFTRILSGAVGAGGRVYAIAAKPSAGVQALAAARPNVTILSGAPGTIPAPEPVDVVWTTLNYHDFKNATVGSGDGAAAINAAAFRALKPGGTYFIVDHEAGAGVGASVTSTLHRIEGAQVKREVEAAGFRLDAESPLLRHPADDHSQKVQETGIRGKTDQFVLRFRKPKR